MNSFSQNNPNINLKQKFLSISWPYVFLVILIASIGFMMLYSVSGGETNTWMQKQIFRFAAGFVLMIFVAVIDIKFWYKVAYPFYFISLILLVMVEIFGTVGMGAQRWIDLGLINIHPSEIMKFALIVSLARYFHGVNLDEIRRISKLIIPIIMIITPALLVLVEPDLGTAALICLEGVVIFFIAGVRIWKFFLVGLIILVSFPFFWNELHVYQQKRILTFFNPESDPLGAGYHILQSKIALGSGGIWGKGFLLGTQSNLNFLPEKHTDFIFTIIAEEFGLAGGTFVLFIYILIMLYGIFISIRARSRFSKILAIGISLTVFIYVFINIAMVTGLVPVVGVPLPLISYGGTSMISILFGLGLVLCTNVHKDVQISKNLSP